MNNAKTTVIVAVS